MTDVRDHAGQCNTETETLQRCAAELNIAAGIRAPEVPKFGPPWAAARLVGASRQEAGSRRLLSRLPQGFTAAWRASTLHSRGSFCPRQTQVQKWSDPSVFLHSSTSSALLPPSPLHTTSPERRQRRGAARYAAPPKRTPATPKADVIPSGMVLRRSRGLVRSHWRRTVLTILPRTWRGCEKVWSAPPPRV